MGLAVPKWLFVLEGVKHPGSLNSHRVQKWRRHSLFLFLQSQQKEMQEILKHLSQQDEKNKELQQMLGQHSNSEVQNQNCLIKQLRQMVAEQEAKIKELEEEVGHLTLQVARQQKGTREALFVTALDVLFCLLLSSCLMRLLARGTNTCPLASLFCWSDKAGILSCNS